MRRRACHRPEGHSIARTCLQLQIGLCGVVEAAWNRAAQNARGFVKGILKGVTRASFGRRAPLMPQLKRPSASRHEEKHFMGVYMSQQVAAVHLGWGHTPSLNSKMTYEGTSWVPLDR